MPVARGAAVAARGRGRYAGPWPPRRSWPLRGLHGRRSCSGRTVGPVGWPGSRSGGRPASSVKSRSVLRMSSSASGRSKAAAWRRSGCNLSQRVGEGFCCAAAGRRPSRGGGATRQLAGQALPQLRRAACVPSCAGVLRRVGREAAPLRQAANASHSARGRVPRCPVEARWRVGREALGIVRRNPAR